MCDASRTIRNRVSVCTVCTYITSTLRGRFIWFLNDENAIQALSDYWQNRCTYPTEKHYQAIYADFGNTVSSSPARVCVPDKYGFSNGTLNISFHSSALQPNKQHEYNFSSIASLWVYSIKCDGRLSFYFWIFHFFSLFVVPNFSSQHFHILFFQNSCMTFGLPRCTALHYRALQLTLINLRRSIQFTGVIAYYADCLLCIDMNR